MAKLPVDVRTKTEVLIEDEFIFQELRKYLGLSSIGVKCSRQLWYGFRLCGREKISARQERLFKRGHREELVIQEDLRKIGIICQVDQDNQPEVICGNGHMKGHCDDILSNVPDAPTTDHLGEYKTHNDKSFKDLKKKGLIAAKPTHYAQMICYMHLFGLKRGLYVGVNKNDDARYYERISENPKGAIQLIQKGVNIINAVIPPQKVGSSTWFECKWCTFYQICYFGEKPLINCRTCKYSKVEDEGKWSCNGYKIEISFERQKIGCKRHKFIPELWCHKE